MEDKIDLITAIKRIKKMKDEISNRNMTSDEYDNLQALNFSLNYLENFLIDIRKRNAKDNINKENE